MNRRNLFKAGMIVFGSIFLSSHHLARPVFAAKKANASQERKFALTLWQLPNKTHSQMMSYIMKTASGEIIVMDGGMDGDADYLSEMIKTISGGKGHVDLWLMTHIHGDHSLALATLLDRGTDIEIKRVCYDFPTVDWVSSYENGSTKYSTYILKQFEKLKNKGKLAPNDPIRFGETEILALNDRDPSITVNAINNSGIVYRIKTPKTTLLFLGDLGIEAGDRLVKLQKPEMLKADVVQMAHHGQQGVRQSFYDLVRPKICLWPTPDWLWDNNIGCGEGSGPWKTVQNRAWMDDLGVKIHYVSKNGLTKLDFE